MAISSPNNMYRRALNYGKLVCKNSIKKAIWEINEKDKTTFVMDRPKIKDGYSDHKNERDYIKR